MSGGFKAKHERFSACFTIMATNIETSFPVLKFSFLSKVFPWYPPPHYACSKLLQKRPETEAFEMFRDLNLRSGASESHALTNKLSASEIFSLSSNTSDDRFNLALFHLLYFRGNFAHYVLHLWWRKCCAAQLRLCHTIIFPIWAVYKSRIYY